MHDLRIALAQVNLTVGDLDGNREKILDRIRKSRDLGAAIVVFPELAVTGYPPEDLLFKPKFIASNLRSLDLIVRETQEITAVIGFIDRQDDIYNAAAIACDGKLVDIYHKTYLPNYGVFDENRYFQAGHTPKVYKMDGILFGVNICEDIWSPGGPAHDQTLSGDAELIVNISSSPYHDGKGRLREQMITTRATDYSAIFAFCNLVGGQDELVFDGASFVVDQQGNVLARAPRFREDLLLADLSVESVFRDRLHDPRRRKDKQTAEPSVQRVRLPSFERHPAPPPLPKETEPAPAPAFRKEDRLRDVYDALVLGTADYVGKNGFRKVLVGLSGGIDSAFVAVVARDALGPDNVICTTMPSRYSSEGTRRDAVQMAERLKIGLITLPIQDIFEAYSNTLRHEFKDRPTDTTEENIQPRIRGNLLMALSNKFGWLVLATGNKSELSMGYATLYGDMAGGFAVIKDIYKTRLYDLVAYRNSLPDGPVIPRSIIQRLPTAELNEDQLDTDSLPPYPILDPILETYVEQDRSLDEIVAAGFEEELVRRVIRTVDLNEYKRRQSPPGVKITPRAFGRDRRLPITNQCRTY